MNIFDETFFMPHGHCFLWIKELLILHVGSDLLIAAAYFTIPFALVYFLRKRPDIEFRPIFFMFAAFILACGVTHIINAWNIWNADYWVSGIAKSFTAAISMLTAMYLWKWMPAALEWPSPAQLHTANEQLRRENASHQSTLASLHTSERLLSGAFDNAPIGKALVGLDGHWLKVNQALCRIVGYNESELLERDFQSITYKDDLERDLHFLNELLEGRRNGYEMEKRYIHKHGNLVWILLSVTLVRNESGTPQYFISQIQDITDRKNAEQALLQMNADLEARVMERTEKLASVNRELAESNRKLEQLVRTDHLSGLYNRRHLMAQLELAMHAAQRYKINLCLVMMDIDHFKSINDKHGHIVGDNVIEAIGAVIKENIRDTDIAARIGGDEFCIALIADYSQSVIVAEKLRSAIGNLSIPGGDGYPFKLTSSFGLCEWHHDLSTPDRLIEAADKALYKAKKAGRDTVISFSSRK